MVIIIVKNNFRKKKYFRVPQLEALINMITIFYLKLIFTIIFDSLKIKRFRK